MDEAKKSCVCVSVRKNSEFYRGALALETFSVSEVNIAPRIRHDFAKIDDCEGGSLFKRSPKRALFVQKLVLTVGDKTPESDHGSSSWLHQNLMGFVALFDVTWMASVD